MYCYSRSILLVPAFLFLAAFGAAGCSKSASSATVSGVVEYKGTALTAGVVTFIGQNNQVASCSIEPDGHYSVTHVPVGPATITVTVPPAPPKPKGYTIPPGGEGTEQVVHIPHTYAEVDKSGLTYTVQPGKQDYKIELK